MKITIKGSPKEIAALVDELQERRKERADMEKSVRLLNHLQNESEDLPSSSQSGSAS